MTSKALKANRLSLNVQEALHHLKAAILEQADHGLNGVNEALHEAGIDHPQGAAGVRDLAGHYRTARQAIVDAMEEEYERLRQRAPGWAPGAQMMIRFVKEMPWQD